MELEKCENAAVFLWLGLPSTLICHENGRCFINGLKPAEFEIATFLLYCGRKTFWERIFSKTMASRHSEDFPYKVLLKHKSGFRSSAYCGRKKFDAVFEVKSPFSNSSGEVRITAWPFISQECKRHITISREYIIFDVYWRRNKFWFRAHPCFIDNLVWICTFNLKKEEERDKVFAYIRLIPFEDCIFNHEVGKKWNVKSTAAYYFQFKTILFVREVRGLAQWTNCLI